MIARAGGPVKAIDDVGGKTVGYGDPASTSSHLIPRALIAKHELIGAKDYKLVHLGTHDAVATPVRCPRRFSRTWWPGNPSTPTSSR